MGKLSIMDHSGHSVVDFTKADNTKAMKKFNELVNVQKFTAAEIKPGGKSKIIRQFNPDAEEIVMMPPLQGG